MSPDKPAGRLLIIDGDGALLDGLGRYFEAAGYQVMTAASGAEGLALAFYRRPNLILLAFRLPDQAGLDVFRALRGRPRTGHIPVMILAAKDEALLQNQALEAGADDFIEKPVDQELLALRVRNVLRRAEREGLTEPRTGLPTGRLIQERLRALEQEPGWSRIDLKIEGFNIFRDQYGFVTANEALRFAGNLILQIMNEHGTPDDFAGHVSGTEEFIVITPRERGTDLGSLLGQRVSQELRSFYSFIERDQGYVLVEDGAGRQVQRPLMSAQVRVDGRPTAGEASGGTPAASPLEW